MELLREMGYHIIVRMIDKKENINHEIEKEMEFIIIIMEIDKKGNLIRKSGR